MPVEVFSGGTAVTAFYKNTLKALQKAGFNFNIVAFNHQNPTYSISFHPEIKPLLGFSKLFDHPTNEQPFFAITTCSSAHENCPFIPSKNAVRLHHNFFDPSKIEGSQEETHDAFEKTRNEIKAYCSNFVTSYL